MKKQLLCLLLSALMVCSVLLTGCSADEEEELGTDTSTSGTRATMTLNMTIPVGPNTTDEAIAAVEEAINDITKAKFKTSIKLNAIPSDEYEAYIDENLTTIENIILEEEAEAKAKREEAKKLKAQGITTVATTEEEISETEEETVLNELGLKELKYPEIATKQMDIILVRDYDTYASYIEREALSMLDDELNGASKILKEYIYPTFLNLAKYEGVTYAIPNNKMIGEYRFLLLNKELIDKYYYDPTTMNTFSRMEDFINTVAKYEPDVTPVLEWTEPVGMYYWSLTGDSPSLLVTQVSNSALYTAKAAPKSIMKVRAWTDNYKIMRRFAEQGYLGDGTAEKFAVGVVSGDASLMEKYAEDYYVSVYEIPRATQEDVYGGMFAVTSYTKNLSRSMEIITYLNTNKEFRTLLGYGVEDVHYEINEDDGLLYKLNNEWDVDINYTGNTYLTYPAEGVSMDFWQYAMQQNLDSDCSPYISFGEYVTDANKANFEALEDLTAEYMERLDNTPVAELDDLLDLMKDELDENEVMVALLNADDENSPAAIYGSFFDENYAVQ